MSEQALPVYTIYDHPLDYPDSFVVRTFLMSSDGPQPTGEVFAAESLELVRRWVQQIAPGTICMSREDEDDPVIVESWF